MIDDVRQLCRAIGIDPDKRSVCMIELKASCDDFTEVRITERCDDEALAGIAATVSTYRLVQKKV